GEVVLEAPQPLRLHPEERLDARGADLHRLTCLRIRDEVGLVAVAELPAVVASAGLGAPAAELPAGRAHRERVGARDAIQGRIELPAVATDRGPVQHELGGPGLDDLPRLGE